MPPPSSKSLSPVGTHQRSRLLPVPNWPTYQFFPHIMHLCKYCDLVVCYQQMCPFTYSGVIGDAKRYGTKLNDVLLTTAVLFFYNNSWKGSTTRSYGTGQRKWAAFTSKFQSVPYLPCPTTPLSEHELALAFFAAHLALTPTISRGTTVAAYLTHVRTL